MDMQDLTDSKRCESPPPQRRLAPIGSHAELSTAGIDRVASVFGLFGAAAILYWPSAVALNTLWGSNSATFHDGYLALLVCFWLIVRERGRLNQAPLHPMPIALVPLAVLSFGWLWAWRSAIQQAHVELLPLLMFAAVVAALGWRAARIVAFPVGYLYFAMPIWAPLNGLLQELSAKMNGLLVWMAGLPAYMQGNLIQLPWGTIEIAGGCSGLNTFVVGLALGALYGKISEASTGRRLLLLGVMGVLALIDNWVRIFVITAVAYATRMQSSLVRHHIWFGWVLFALTFAAFLWWAERWCVADDLKRSVEPSASHENPAPSKSRRTTRIAMVMTFVALAVLPLLSYGMDWARGNEPLVRIQWPVPALGWKGPRPSRSSVWDPNYVNASGESLVQYTDPANEVQAYTVVYRIQTQNGKLFGYWNTVLGDPKRLRALSRRIVSSPSGHWREIVAIDRDGQRSLIWLRYRIGNRFFVDPLLAQLWYGLEALVRPPLSSLTALRAICRPDCKSAQNGLDAATMWARPKLR